MFGVAEFRNMQQPQIICLSMNMERNTGHCNDHASTNYFRQPLQGRTQCKPPQPSCSAAMNPRGQRQHLRPTLHCSARQISLPGPPCLLKTCTSDLHNPPTHTSGPRSMSLARHARFRRNCGTRRVVASHSKSLRRERPKCMRQAALGSPQ